MVLGDQGPLFYDSLGQFSMFAGVDDVYATPQDGYSPSPRLQGGPVAQRIDPST